MLWTDLREMKSILSIDNGDTSEDRNLNFLNTWCSSWIEELLGRSGRMFYQSRTEYYDTTSTGIIALKSRPVYASPVIQIFLDPSGFYGSASGSFNTGTTQQVYGQDFCLKIDQPDGIRSRCGLLIPIGSNSNGTNLTGAWWNNQRTYQQGLLSPYLSTVPGSIKIIYWAGFTVDDLPESFRMAANLLIARLRYVLPLGVELNSESYEERSIAAVNSEKDKLIALVKPMLWSHRNWAW